jgi:hypothetical protein
MRRLFVVLLVATAMVLPSQASARRERELSYQYAQVWSAAVRLLRVDFQFPIADRDEGNGFLLFEYRDPQGRTYQASLELVPITRDGQTTVRVVSNVSSMPSYVEGVLIDRLEAKLRQDFGAPIRRTRPPAQAPSRDAETEPSDEAPSETPPTDGTTPTAG